MNFKFQTVIKTFPLLIMEAFAACDYEPYIEITNETGGNIIGRTII
jgi:hypothetical protein